MSASDSHHLVARAGRTPQRWRHALREKQRVYLGIALILAVCVSGWIVGGILDLWGPGPIGNFLYGLIEYPAMGSIAIGVLAVCAALIAYRGVLRTISATNDRAISDREAVDDREREAARHDRFLRSVEQLASPHSTIRMGGLLAVGALADEWEREARSLLLRDPDEKRVELEVQRVELFRSAIENYRDAQGAGGRAWGEPDMADRKHAENTFINASDQLLVAREDYLMIRSSIPAVAQDALGQRDACIALVCSYLREGPIPSDTSIGAKCIDQPELLYEKKRSYALGGNDIPARQVAVALIRNHAQPDSTYIWPGVEIDLEYAHLEYANLDLVVLDGVSLKAAYLNNTEINWARLSHACLDGAKITGASLIHTHFEHATLKDADLKYAFLDEAFLQNVNLSGTDMEEASLRAACLGGEKTKDEVQLISWTSGPATWNEETEWPAGFNAEEVIERQMRARGIDSKDDV